MKVTESPFTGGLVVSWHMAVTKAASGNSHVKIGDVSVPQRHYEVMTALRNDGGESGAVPLGPGGVEDRDGYFWPESSWLEKELLDIRPAGFPTPRGRGCMSITSHSANYDAVPATYHPAAAISPGIPRGRPICAQEALCAKTIMARR
jgi:hypothetical protein